MQIRTAVQSGSQSGAVASVKVAAIGTNGGVQGAAEAAPRAEWSEQGHGHDLGQGHGQDHGQGGDEKSGHRHSHDGAPTAQETGRLQARLEGLSVALTRLAVQSPAAQGARFTAIIVWRSGEGGVAGAIAGAKVRGVHPEARGSPEVAGVGEEAIAGVAVVAADAGRIVGKVDGGAGNDAMAVAAQVSAGVIAGVSDDVIAGDAFFGAGGAAQAESWLSPVEVSAEVLLARARAAYGDVDGGAGNDVIAVNIGSVLAVSGGQGDAVIAALGGTMALLYGAGDGNDIVTLGAGSQVMVQISGDMADYALEFGVDSMTVRLGEGRITFRGVTAAGIIGIRQGEGAIALVSQPPAAAVLDRAV